MTHPRDPTRPMAAGKPPLRIRACAGEAWQLFLRRPWTFVLLALLAAGVSMIPNLALLMRSGPEFNVVFNTERGQALARVIVDLGIWLFQIIVSAITTGLILAHGWELRQDRQARLGSAVARCGRQFASLTINTLVTSILCLLAALPLLLPGLWLIGVFALVLPVILIEGHGLGAMRRSARLTRGYRWPIIGLLLISIGPQMALAGVDFLSRLHAPGFEGEPISLASTFLQILIATLVLPLLQIPLYARLIDIQEGSGGNDLEVVFA